MTAGRNKGKKYKKLQGFEEPTELSQANATAFMYWYGKNFERLRDKLIFAHLYDDEVATDTALTIYDNIALKGVVILDYQFYFLRAYHTNRVAKANRKAREISYDEGLYNEFNKMDNGREPTSNRTSLAVAQLIAAAPDFDYEEYELAVDQLSTEMLDYVRANYDPLSVSLFEIYVGLLPGISYKKLSALLGIPVTRIWTSLGEIRKDLAERFAERKENLLSVI